MTFLRLAISIAASFLLFCSRLSAQEFSSFSDVLPIKDFSLADIEGNAFSPRDLRGKTWVVHFFYTTCTQGCAKTALTMMELQKEFAGRVDVALVSISLNNDSPQILQSYAGSLGADLKQWHILTGPTDKVHAVVQTCFYQTAANSIDPSPGKEIDHSFNLMVVDSEGNITGYVDGRDPNAAAAVAKQVNALTLSVLPTVNAALNALCAALLALGYVAIRNRREAFHKNCMLAALVVSMVFLSSYLYYHIVVRHGVPTSYQGHGWIRGAYFTILLTHTALAAIVPPLAIYVTYQGFRDNRLRHRRVARWTFPIWLYVSITGVVVYAMLYLA